MSDLMKRIFVKVTGFKPKVFDEAEKKKVCEDLIRKNRNQDRDITTCPEKLIQGLTIRKIGLPQAEGWLVTASDNPKEKIIYYIHGGGFTGACTKDRMPFVSTLVKDFGYNVFSIDYRLAPEFMFPAGLNDCLDGYRWLLEEYSPENMVLIGESAGGNFVFSLPLLLRDQGMPLPKAIYSNSPAVQFLEYFDSFAKFSLKTDFIIVQGILDNIIGVYMRKDEVQNPYVSPLYADLSGLPPVFITASECESLLDDSLAMAEKLEEAGNDVQLKTYPKLCHAFIISPQMKAVVKNAYPDLKKFLDDNLG